VSRRLSRRALRAEYWRGDDAAIVAYADSQAELKWLWPEATEIDAQTVTGYTFTTRFPRPDWFLGRGIERPDPEPSRMCCGSCEHRPKQYPGSIDATDADTWPRCFAAVPSRDAAWCCPLYLPAAADFVPGWLSDEFRRGRDPDG